MRWAQRAQQRQRHRLMPGYQWHVAYQRRRRTRVDSQMPKRHCHVRRRLLPLRCRPYRLESWRWAYLISHHWCSFERHRVPVTAAASADIPLRLSLRHVRHRITYTHTPLSTWSQSLLTASGLVSTLDPACYPHLLILIIIRSLRLPYWITF
jgi:hypothetical protein